MRLERDRYIRTGTGGLEERRERESGAIAATDDGFPMKPDSGIYRFASGVELYELINDRFQVPVIISL